MSDPGDPEHFGTPRRVITVFTRRRDSLLRDPALGVIAGLLLLIAFLVIRVNPEDLQNRALQSGLDLFYADLLRFHPTSRGANLIAGVLLLQAICVPAFHVLMPQALEIQASVLDRQRELEVCVFHLLWFNLCVALGLAALYGPVIKMGLSSGTMLWFEDGVGCLMLSIYQGLLIALWMALWYAPRPARLWQRLCAWLMPIVWTIDLLLYAELAIGWTFDSMKMWLITGAFVSAALIVKLRIWESAARSDDAHP